MRYLYSTNKQEVIDSFTFNRRGYGNEAIFNHFDKPYNLNDILLWCNGEVGTATPGDNVVAFYGINPSTQKPARIFTLGKRVFYLDLNKDVS